MTDRRCAHRQRSAASRTSDTADPDRAIVRPHLSVPADDHPYVLATRLDPPHPTNAQCRPQPTSLRPDHCLTPARASANARHETAGLDRLVRRSSAARYRKNADFRPFGCDLEPTKITEIRDVFRWSAIGHKPDTVLALPTRDFPRCCFSRTSSAAVPGRRYPDARRRISHRLGVLDELAASGLTTDTVWAGPGFGRSRGRLEASSAQGRQGRRARERSRSTGRRPRCRP